MERCEFGSSEHPCPNLPRPGTFFCLQHWETLRLWEDPSNGARMRDNRLQEVQPLAAVLIPLEATGVVRRAAATTRVEASPSRRCSHAVRSNRCRSRPIVGFQFCYRHLPPDQQALLQEQQNQVREQVGGCSCWMPKLGRFCKNRSAAGAHFCKVHAHMQNVDQGGHGAEPAPAEKPRSPDPETVTECPICFETFDSKKEALPQYPDLKPAHSGPEGDGKAPVGDASSCQLFVTNCGHRYCRDCIRQYVAEQVSSAKIPILCPDLRCRTLLNHHSLSSALGSEDMEALHRAELQAAISSDCRFVQCPYKDCTGVAEVLPPENFITDVMFAPLAFNCPVCKKSSCVECRQPVHEGRCRPVLSAELEACIRGLKAKRCPGCAAVVERNQGCNHMKCRCGTHFCYVCEVRLDPETYSDHYNPKHPFFGEVPISPPRQMHPVAAPTVRFQEHQNAFLRDIAEDVNLERLLFAIRRYVEPH